MTTLKWEGRTWGTVLVLLLAGSLLPISCARPGRPPGGPPDRIPPMVVKTWPDTFEVIEATRDPAVITFSERISERPVDGRSLDQAVLVSPYTGEAEVKHIRSGLEVSVLGGFKPDLVYRIRVRETVKDLFNNAMEGPFELVFSTGAEFYRHVLGGVVTDRITGEPVEGARVEARRMVPGQQRFEVAEDAVPYVTMTDTAGIYLLRYVPPEAFELEIYLDNNRNREPDFREAQGTDRVEVGTRPTRVDTVISYVSILQPDTVPAELIRVEVVDSALLKLSFDDFLLPEQDLEQVGVRLLIDEGQEDPTVMAAGPAVDRFLWQRQVDSMVAVQDSIRAADSLSARLDSLQITADSLENALPSLAAAGDTAAVLEVQDELSAIRRELESPEPPGAGMRGEEEVEEVEEEPILPEQVFFTLLASPLEPGQLYRVEVSGVENVNELPGGGGSSGVTWTPPEPTDPDSAGVGLRE